MKHNSRANLKLIEPVGGKRSFEDAEPKTVDQVVDEL
jgi:hypothetical protein